MRTRAAASRAPGGTGTVSSYPCPTYRASTERARLTVPATAAPRTIDAACAAMSSYIAVSAAGSSASSRRTQVRATSNFTSAASSPMAAVTPAAAGRITRGMPSAWASRQPCTGPEPPKATNVRSRGSRPRSTDTTREAVADRAGRGRRALGPDGDDAEIRARAGAAAGADLDEVDRLDVHRQPAARRPVHAMQLEGRRRVRPAVLDQRELGRRAAHVERHEVAMTRQLALG